MRRKMLKALSVTLGALLCGSAHAQDMDDIVLEYGVEPPPEPIFVEPVMEYGSYPVEFRRGWFDLTGRVVLAGTETPIQGIRLSFQGQTAWSLSDGTFSFTVVAPDGSAQLELLAEDTDGRKHGGKHRASKLTVQIVDGALSPADSQQGYTVEMKKK